MAEALEPTTGSPCSSPGVEDASLLSAVPARVQDIEQSIEEIARSFAQWQHRNADPAVYEPLPVEAYEKVIDLVEELFEAVTVQMEPKARHAAARMDAINRELQGRLVGRRRQQLHEELILQQAELCQLVHKVRRRCDVIAKLLEAHQPAKLDLAAIKREKELEDFRQQIRSASARGPNHLGRILEKYSAAQGVASRVV